MPSQPCDVDKGFLKELYDYDPKLRVVWDRKDAYWRIERKAARARAMKVAPNPLCTPEDWAAAEDGYVLVMRVPHGCLDSRVFYTLAAGDVQARGGYKRVADEMDEEYWAHQARSRRRFLDDREYQARERWTNWNSNYPKTKYGSKDKAPGHWSGR